MICISRSQAKEFALTIHIDIVNYIASHQDEYQKFLLEELDKQTITKHR